MATKIKILGHSMILQHTNTRQSAAIKKVKGKVMAFYVEKLSIVIATNLTHREERSVQSPHKFRKLQH